MANGSFQPRPDSGTLFINQPTDERHPVLKGKVTLSPALLSTLVAQIQAGLPAEIEIAGWHNQGAKGPYYSIKVGLPYQAQGGANGPGPQRTPMPPQRQGAYPAAPPAQRPIPRQAGASQGWGAVPNDDDGPVPF